MPISRLAECILETKSDVVEAKLLAPLVGHVGDGNFHLSFIIHPDDPTEMARAQAVNDRMVHRALAMGGTCTGEHGIGSGKIACLEEEHASAMPSHAADQAGARSRQPDESGQGAAAQLTRSRSTKTRSSQRSNLRPTSGRRPTSRNPKVAWSAKEAPLPASIPPTIA